MFTTYSCWTESFADCENVYKIGTGIVLLSVEENWLRLPVLCTVNISVKIILKRFVSNETVDRLVCCRFCSGGFWYKRFEYTAYTQWIHPQVILIDLCDFSTFPIQPSTRVSFLVFFRLCILLLLVTCQFQIEWKRMWFYPPIIIIFSLCSYGHNRWW